MEHIAAYIILTTVMLGLIGLMRRALRQRPYARQLRSIFYTEANDLVGKAEVPDAHVRQLVKLAQIPHGLLTRYMVVMLFLQMLGFGKKRTPLPELAIDRIPAALQGKYVKAMLAYVWADSFQCAVLGPIWRGANSWIGEALHEVKPDVNAHATRHVVDTAARYTLRDHRWDARELACA